MKRLALVIGLVLVPMIAALSTSTRSGNVAQAAPKFVHLCGSARPGFARCHAIRLMNPNKPRPTPTGTGTATATNTSVATSTSTATNTPTNTATATSTATSTTTPTITNTPTNTATATATGTATPTNTAIPTNTPTITATPINTPVAGTCYVPPSPPSGYGPCDLQSAYNLPASTAGSGQTVAVVDAYDDPNAESDLQTYRNLFHLPTCTTANGCFTKIDQNGGTAYPAANSNWAGEISLDLDMVSAACPRCRILLVEATDANLSNLGTAVNTAASHGATEISNSYGGSESSSDPTYDQQYFNHPGIPITVSAGDGGYGAQYPAASQYVTAVGGTSLKRDSTTSRGWSETAWSCSAGLGCAFLGGTGSGCSAYDPQPAWQSPAKLPANNACSNRAIADVSAVADPNTGVAVYDSYSSSGWQVIGGTSASSPLVASVYALAGNGASVTYGSYPYSHTASLFDVTSGSNGSCGNYLCNAQPGYDGPTGLGTPNGVGAF